MNTLLTTIIIGISLSMDAFSLSLVYGLEPINKNNKILLSIIVGIYHFIMPIIGLYFGKIIINFLPFKVNILVAIIFMVIGIDMIYSSFKNKEEKLSISILSFLLFGLSVSIDSFTTGIGINIINNNYLEVSTIFALTSSIFTYIGLKLGNRINKKLGPISSLLGGIILLILSVYYYTI